MSPGGNMDVLVLNSGSSSIKYQVFDMAGGSMRAHGVLEQIGQEESSLRHVSHDSAGASSETVDRRRISGHGEGLGWVFSVLSSSGALMDAGDLLGIGHRVVHGGREFSAPALIDGGVLEAVRRTIPLAPLHNPANLEGIEAAMALCPGVPQVAVFDTAFHSTIPAHASTYALPHGLCEEHGIRRYGFHGTSHYYVSKRAAEHLGRPPGDLDLITLHLGNGASAAAVKGGRSIDTSMGMTPLEGLVMGTRSGDLDPAVGFYLQRAAGFSPAEVEDMLYSRSGLKGLCGSGDMRDVERLAAEGDPRAALAVEVFCYRVRKYIGAYFAVLGRVDALVFTGGIGENSATVRRKSCEGLDALGIRVDGALNSVRAGHGVREIQAGGSGVKVLVIKTDEELEIARLTVETIRAARGGRA